MPVWLPHILSSPAVQEAERQMIFWECQKPGSWIWESSASLSSEVCVIRYTDCPQIKLWVCLRTLEAYSGIAEHNFSFCGEYFWDYLSMFEMPLCPWIILNTLLLKGGIHFGVKKCRIIFFLQYRDTCSDNCKIWVLMRIPYIPGGFERWTLSVVITVDCSLSLFLLNCIH